MSMLKDCAQHVCTFCAHQLIDTICKGLKCCLAYRQGTNKFALSSRANSRIKRTCTQGTIPQIFQRDRCICNDKEFSVRILTTHCRPTWWAKVRDQNHCAMENVKEHEGCIQQECCKVWHVSKTFHGRKWKGSNNKNTKSIKFGAGMCFHLATHTCILTPSALASAVSLFSPTIPASNLCSFQGSLYCQPKQCTYKEQTTQNSHTLALFDASNTGNSITPALTKHWCVVKEQRSWHGEALARPPHLHLPYHSDRSYPFISFILIILIPYSYDTSYVLHMFLILPGNTRDSRKVLLKLRHIGLRRLRPAILPLSSRPGSWTKEASQRNLGCSEKQ